MARKTKQEAEETRSNILKAALDVIYEKGYARSTFVDIAERINLTKGAVYWHFKSKPDMFLALGRQMEDKIEVTLESVLGEPRSLFDLRQMLFEMIMLISEDEQLRKYYTIVFFRMEWTEDLLPIKQYFDHQDQLMMEWIVEILLHARSEEEIPQGKNIYSLSRALLGLVGGFLAYCLSDSDERKEQVSQIIQTGLDTFFIGMRSNDEPVNKADLQ